MRFGPTRTRRGSAVGMLRAREYGYRSSAAPPIQAFALDTRLGAVGLSTHVELSMAHTEAVTSLSLDPVESRFLLSGSADASVALYDVIDRPSAPSTQPEVTEPLAKIHRRHTGAHRFMITGVEWFPHDTGLFASSSTDGTIKLWDTNELRVAAEFAPGGAVHRIAMSHAATTHTLIAAAAEQSYAVQLCDPVSGTATHQLSGHRQAVSALSWSPSDENQLVSGGADRSIRVWDLCAPLALTRLPCPSSTTS